MEAAGGTSRPELRIPQAPWRFVAGVCRDGARRSQRGFESRARAPASQRNFCSQLLPDSIGSPTFLSGRKVRNDIFPAQRLHSPALR